MNAHRYSQLLIFQALRRDLEGVGHAALRLGRRLQRWQALRRQRCQLGCLSDAAAKDLGLSRADILAEQTRPFWDDPMSR